MAETGVIQLKAKAYQQAPEARRRHGPESDLVSGGSTPFYHLGMDFVHQEW